MLKKYLIILFLFVCSSSVLLAQNDDATQDLMQEMEQMAQEFEKLFGDMGGQMHIMVDTLELDDLNGLFDLNQGVDFAQEFEQMLKMMEQQMQQFNPQDFEQLFEGFDIKTIPAPENWDEDNPDAQPDAPSETPKKKKKRKTIKI